MNEPIEASQEQFSVSKLFQYFLQGLLLIAPITITIYTIYWVVSSIDNLVPLLTEQSRNGEVRVRNYGLGFLVVIVAICLIGYLSNFFFKASVV